MRDARLSIRVSAENPLHHLWRNNGTSWVHYTLNTLDGRIRRMYRSLGTADAFTAIAQRDRLLARLGRLAGNIADNVTDTVAGKAAFHVAELAR